MSRIQQIQPNSQPISQHGQKTNFASRQSFGAEVPDFKLPDEALKVIVKEVRPEIKKRLGLLGTAYQYMSDTQGEIQNNLVNALFTTTLAPFWIAYNPFTKKSKEDKAYLALRQPISAVIALAGALPMTYGINKYIGYLQHTGNYETIDMRVCPSREYLKPIFKKEYKDAKKNNLAAFLSKYDADVDDVIKEKKVLFSRFFHKQGCFKAYMKEIQDQRLDFFTSLITEKNLDKIDLIKRVEELQNTHTLKVKGFDKEAELTKYLNANNLYKRSFGDFMKERFKFEFYEDGSFKPHSIKEKLDQTLAMDFLRETGLIEEGKITEEALKRMLMENRQSFHVEENAKVLNIPNDKAARDLAIKGADTSRNIEMTLSKKVTDAESINLTQFLHILGYKSEDGTLQELMNNKMDKALNKFKGKFEGKLEGFGEPELKDIAKRMLKFQTKRLSKNSSNSLKYAGMFFNLFVTAITCTVLNWAYPKFVKKFFSSLVPDKEKGGKK